MANVAKTISAIAQPIGGQLLDIAPDISMKFMSPSTEFDNVKARS